MEEVSPTTLSLSWPVPLPNILGSQRVHPSQTKPFSALSLSRRSGSSPCPAYTATATWSFSSHPYPKDLGSLPKVCLSHKTGHSGAWALLVTMSPFLACEVLDSGDIKVSIFQGTPVTLHEVSAVRCTPDSTVLTQQGLRHNASSSAERNTRLLGPRCHSYYPCLPGWSPPLF